MKVSGISTGFPVLSRSSGQVPHVLLTRSPLSTRASPGFSFDLHVLGAPPAFVLSQDQTLHRDLNPTSNAVEHEIGELPVRVTSAPFRQLCTTAPEGCSPCGINGDVSHDTPALAFGVTVPFSRSHHSTPERAYPSRERRADTHLCLHHSREGRGRQERPCQSDPKSFSGRIGDTTGRAPVLQAGARNFHSGS